MTPFRSRYVTVAVAVVGRLPAVVETEDERDILLALSVRAPVGLDRPVRVECVTPRGIQRVTGTASWDASLPDLLRVRRDDDALIQRRDTVRVQAVMPAKLIVTDGAQASADTITLNLSATGLLVKDPLKLALGTAVRVELAVDDGAGPLVVGGRVVRDAGQGEKGIYIDDISRADQSRLTRIITQRQRAELRVARGE